MEKSGPSLFDKYDGAGGMRMSGPKKVGNVMRQEPLFRQNFANRCRLSLGGPLELLCQLSKVMLS